MPTTIKRGGSKMITAKSVMLLFVIAIVMFTLHMYMYKRLKVMAKDIDAGTYYPNIKLSVVELLVFFAVFYISNMLIIDYEEHQTATVISSVLALALSTMFMNRPVLGIFKNKLLAVTTVAMTAYYALVMYISTTL